MSDAHRVLLADEHATMRAGIRMSLEGHGFAVVAEAGSRDEAIAAAARETPELCLLDADLPGGGVDAAEEILTCLPETTVVMLAAAIDDDALFGALAAGAHGYLLKDMDPSRLPHALEGALAGEAAMPRALMARVLSEFRGRRRRRSPANLERLGVQLTEREWDVLELLRRDLSTGAIAERLSVSPVTVRRHVSELLHKLGVSSRADAVALVEDRVQD